MEPAQSPSRRSGQRRLLPIVVTVALTLDIAAAVGTAIYQTHARDPQTGTERESHARAVPGQARSSPDANESGAARDDGRGRRSAVRTLLAQRARAIRTGDREAFLATVATAESGFRAEQRRLFANLKRLPLAGWRYDLVSEGSHVHERAGRSSANVWTPRLLVRYHLEGFDEAAITTKRYLTFALGPDGWRVTGVGDRTVHRIWDLGRIRVVRTDHALVLGLGTAASRLRSIAGHMELAVPVVSKVWGTDWSRRAVVLVPATQRQAQILSPDEDSLGQITAIATVVAGPHHVPPPGTGDRVIVNPTNFSKLSELGRRVVLRHELTHVATRAYTDPSMPMWLIEGFADYVGYQDVGLSKEAVARELGAAVRSGHPPTQLPTHADFAGTSTHLTRAYESAWLACELIAQRHGEPRLVRLYRVMGSDPDKGRREVLRSVIGKTPREFTDAWRSYVRGTLG